MNKLTTLTLAAATLATLASCSKSDKADATPTPSAEKTTGTAKAGAPAKGANALVGTWQDADGAETITYGADGKMTEKLSSGDVVTGTYSMPDAGHVKVTFEGAMAAMGEQTFPVKISGDTMEMTGPTGAAMQYKKVK